MNNSELFKQVFGIYAEEFWAYPEEKMLDWLTSDVPNTNVGENVHGRWVVDEDGNIECSVCGHHGVGDLYCERCGAQMDKDA